MENSRIQVFTVPLKIYARSEAEVNDMAHAVMEFISEHAKENRAVTASKVAQAVRNWRKNPIVRTQIINYFR
jgi:hypothetical protein